MDKTSILKSHTNQICFSLKNFCEVYSKLCHYLSSVNFTFFWFLKLIFSLKYEALGIKYKAWISLRACMNSGPVRSHSLNSCPWWLSVPWYWTAFTSTRFASLLRAQDMLKTLGHWNVSLTPCFLSEDHWLTPRKKDLSSKLCFSWYQLSTHSSRSGKIHIPGQRLSDILGIYVQWQNPYSHCDFCKSKCWGSWKNFSCWLSARN